MKHYKGAVFFVDLLGVGALTKKQVALSDADYIARSISQGDRNEQIFCASQLTAFRRVLMDAKSEYKRVNVTQLSDCAFIWSSNPIDVLNAARKVMWGNIRAGLLCRGGIAYGEIVEPGKVNRSIGEFILGEAVTKAAGLEKAGKGCRVFSDIDLPTELSGRRRLINLSFGQLENPLDGGVVDEFRWYMLPNKITGKEMDQDFEREAAIGISELTNMLKHSPLFGWNAYSEEGRIHLAVSIQSISSAMKELVPGMDFRFSAETLKDHLTNRSDRTFARTHEVITREIERAFARPREKG